MPLSYDGTPFRKVKIFGLCCWFVRVICVSLHCIARIRKDAKVRPVLILRASTKRVISTQYVQSWCEKFKISSIQGWLCTKYVLQHAH